MKKVLAIVVMLLCCGAYSSVAQDTLTDNNATLLSDTIIVSDSIALKTAAEQQQDSIRRNVHNPRKATIRSAILPGWGQVYNKKYWKVPIVYTAIGIPVGTFFYNKSWYNQTREAARMIATGDTLNFRTRVNPQLHFFFSQPNSSGRLLNYRNEFRRNMDYSILITLLMWGLNVVDATVDGHLKEFDVSDDLSMRIKPVLLPGTLTPGVSVVVRIGK